MSFTVGIGPVPMTYTPFFSIDIPNAAANAVMDHPLLGEGVLSCSLSAAGMTALQSILRMNAPIVMNIIDILDVTNPRTSSNLAGNVPKWRYLSLR